ncbi:hypothetical protein FB451DRAFT_1195729 [Mycena latifolia]|nr:hypothetical protein FB451DRAFT_1195729 [Mycena latifolia]
MPQAVLPVQVTALFWKSVRGTHLCWLRTWFLAQAEEEQRDIVTMHLAMVRAVASGKLVQRQSDLHCVKTQLQSGRTSHWQESQGRIRRFKSGSLATSMHSDGKWSLFKCTLLKEETCKASNANTFSKRDSFGGAEYIKGGSDCYDGDLIVLKVQERAVEVKESSDNTCVADWRNWDSASGPVVFAIDLNLSDHPIIGQPPTPQIIPISTWDITDPNTTGALYSLMQIVLSQSMILLCEAESRHWLEEWTSALPATRTTDSLF